VAGSVTSPNSRSRADLDLAVLPSLRRETYSMVLQEAIAMPAGGRLRPQRRTPRPASGRIQRVGDARGAATLAMLTTRAAGRVRSSAATGKTARGRCVASTAPRSTRRQFSP
jgi:hypothetical protein